MRILIISNSRCGSTNLMKSISSAYGIPHVFEPFLFNTEFDINKPLVIKTLINQNTLDFYRKFIPLFDKVIFLSRRNTIEMTESIISLVNRVKKEDYDYSLNLHLKEYEYDLDPDMDIVDTLMYRKVCARKNNIIKLSNEFNIPVDYYEDVFYGDKTLNDKNIKLDLSFLDTNLKLRKK